MAQNLTGENIDEFDEFLSFHQHFPHQIFPLIISVLFACQTTFRTSVIVASIRGHAKFFPVQSICK